jgi:hypothetical protein
MRRALALALALLPCVTLSAEGKWLPQQVLELGPRWLREQGFALPPERLWDPHRGQGLLANAVQLPRCSGSFVSADGLLVTNHHCVVGILQQHATPAANLVRDGFVARTREEEKPARAYPVQVPKRFADVTPEVLGRVPPGADDLARFRAVEAATKAIVAQCEREPRTRCEVAALDGGLRFTLTAFTELTDVRLVWAPPSGVGDFGGEVDNWTWPRHTGDFALLRVYDGGAPYRPPVFFPVSPEGVKPGDAVAVLGYPGVSWRSWLAAEVAEREERFFPAVRALFGEWVALVEEEAARDPQAAIATADELRNLLNRRKNAEGQLAGLRRQRAVEGRREAEARVLAHARARGDGAAAEAHAALVGLAAERLRGWERDFLLDASAQGALGLRWALTLARRAHEAAKPDAEREPGFQERDLRRLRDELSASQSRFSPAVEKRLLASWVRRALALPAGERLAAVDAAFGAGADAAAVSRQVDELYAGTRLADAGLRARRFDAGAAELAAERDPLLDLGLALDAERRALKERRDAWAGAGYRLRPPWRRAVLAEAGRPLAPDANRTLRVTFGRVNGYAPREAVTFAAQTTLGGLAAKHTGEEPFAAPARVLAAAPRARASRFADRRLRDVPVAFLADCDTTGGNSGSPVVDGRGRLVGVNFDRVWENVANDFGYDPAVARNVSADARFMLWLLEEVDGASALVAELGAAPRRRK